MKILLTVEEYKERIISNIMEVIKKTINPDADDYFKFVFIEKITEEALSNYIGRIDQCNQLFFKNFCCDREGNPLCLKTLRQIDAKEAEKFLSQDYYKDYIEKCRKDYKSYYTIQSYKKIKKEEFEHALFEIKRCVVMPFVSDGYNIEKEVFRRLYGRDFEYDRDWKFFK